MDIDVRSGSGLRERTVEAIGLGIVDGTYPPGHRFANQEDLSAQLGVSRNVLREAFGSLRDKGLIEARPKAGTIVADTAAWAMSDPDVLRWSAASRSAPTTLHHVAEACLIIEPAAARLAALRRSNAESEEIVRLGEALAECADDDPKRIETELALRQAVFRAAANPIVAHLAETIRGALVGSPGMTDSVTGGAANPIGLYCRVAEAIRDGDGPEAARVMAELVEASAADVLDQR
ncbi:FadR/GntR family transcriptional regulator [Candidatus Poriferisodalis sp.]|uniref:FadR/GntR family transcriptional regulator n=1 Tax=Candidatus Poriferisodalis sp. TaxID=3101277 RepID=UPI003B02DDF9